MYYWYIFSSLSFTFAYIIPPGKYPRSSSSIIRFNAGSTTGGNNNNNNDPPSSTKDASSFYDDSPENNNNFNIFAKLWDTNINDDDDDNEYAWNETMRGGAAAAAASTAVVNNKDGKPAVVETTISYWKGVFGSVVTTITTPIRVVNEKVSNVFKSKEKKYEEELLEKLRTMPVRRVIVPNTTVLPSDVIQIAAQRSGVLGSPLKSDKVQDFATNVKRWYNRKGYVLHSVTGATLKADTATAEISVQEPINSNVPVGITFYKEMIVDNTTGELLTFRQYKERYQRRNSFLMGEAIKKEDLNTTLVPTNGWTKPNRIASALNLQPGQPFQWDNMKWQQITNSGIFSRIFQAIPQPMNDGGIQLHIVAVEAPTRHLEYGIGKSLYTGGWEGELDFQHGNVFGGGETLGVSVRRGTHDTQPSISVKFSHGRLGLEGGYDIEAFSEYIGNNDIQQQQPTTTTTTTMQTKSFDTTTTEDNVVNGETKHDNSNNKKNLLALRRGATFCVKNPIDTRTIQNSAASASFERATTGDGSYETIGSTTMDVGPFIRELPLGARSNLDISVMAGTRVAGHEQQQQQKQKSITKTSSSFASFAFGKNDVIPFASATATTRQLFPLFGRPRRPVILALRHSLTASTHNSLPQHIAKAIGMATSIRGTAPNGHVSSAVRGTTELRLPIHLPDRLKARQDMNFVLYGDWLLAHKDSTSPFFRKSAVGLGLRKTIQGIPLQYDVTYSAIDGKIKGGFGLGSDFVF